MNSKLCMCTTSSHQLYTCQFVSQSEKMIQDILDVEYTYTKHKSAYVVGYALRIAQMSCTRQITLVCMLQQLHIIAT